MFTSKNAQNLVPGDRIVTDRNGTIQTVVGQTVLNQYGGCSIATTAGRILTQLPCEVKVVE